MKKWPSKEYPLELLETVDAIVDHFSLLQIKRGGTKKTWERLITSSDLKRHQNANNHAKSMREVTLFTFPTLSRHLESKSANSLFYEAFHWMT